MIETLTSFKNSKPIFISIKTVSAKNFSYRFIDLKGFGLKKLT